MKFRQSAEKAKAEIKPPQQQPKQKTSPRQAAARQTNPRELWLELEANNLSSWRTGGSRFNHMNRKKLQATRSVAALRGQPQPLLLKSLPPPRPPSQTCIPKASFQHISARLLLSKPAVIISNQQNCCNDARLRCQG